jgi:hypothetical protein
MAAKLLKNCSDRVIRDSSGPDLVLCDGDPEHPIAAGPSVVSNKADTPTQLTAEARHKKPFLAGYKLYMGWAH